MVTQYGMSEALGPLTFGKKEEMIFLGREISEQRNYSDEVAAKIDAEVRSIIDHAYDRAREALTAHRAVLDRLADLLIEKETIEAAEFESLWDGVLPPRDVGGPTPADVPAGDEEPEAADDGAKPTPRRRRGPAPQPA
jgi:cell division protease FtsH